VPDTLLLRLLGPLEATGRDGCTRPVAGERARALLAELALARGNALSSETLIDALWEDEPPGNPRGALQALVSRTRRVLPEGTLVSTEHGYALADTMTDLAQAETLPEDAGVLLLRATLALWRGDPGDGLPPELGSRVAARADAARRRLRRTLAGALSRAGESDPAKAEEAAALWAQLWDESPYDDTVVQALMRALDAAGRPAEALDVFGRHRTRLREELGADPGGALSELNASLLRGQERPADAARHRGLRAAATELIGRESALEEVAALLLSRRLVTILGAGGLGKTRLAQEVAARTVAARPGADTLVLELAPLDTPSDVLPALAALLGVGGVRPGKRLSGEALVDVRSQVITALGERPALLVMDNCEHLVQEAASLATELLERVASLRILTTSRAPLAVPEEAVFSLEPLPVQEDGAAVRLFTTRARAARPGALLPLDLVRSVCARLDGSPLAIELAAARVRGMSVDELHARLDDRFGLLRGGDRSAPPRHRTLLAVIEWSWDLLAAGAKELLPRLALFPDGFTLQAAEAVAPPARRDDAFDDLAELVEQSLVQLVERAGEPVRYRLLETVREFGSARLGGGADEVRTAMIGWGVGFSRTHPALRAVGQEQLELFLATRREADTLVVLLRWAVAARDAEATAALFSCLGAHWAMRAAVEEIGGVVLDVGDVLLEPDLPSDPVTATELAASLSLVVLWGLVAERRLAARARPRLRRLLASGRVQDRLTSAHGQLVLTAPARRRWEPLARRMSQDEDPRVAVMALSLRIPDLENGGRLGEALELGERLDALVRRHGLIWPAGLIGVLLAQVYVEVGRPEKALAAAERAHALMEPYGGLGSSGPPGDLDWTFGVAAAQVGQEERAEEIVAALRSRAAQEREQAERPEEQEREGFPGRGEPPLAQALALLVEAELAAHRGHADAAAELSGQAMTEVLAAASHPRDPRAWPMVVILGGAHLTTLAATGRTDDAVAHQVRVTALVSLRMRPLGPDLPVLGLGILGLALWGALSGVLSDAAVARGWALGTALGARQDFLASRHAAVRGVLLRRLPAAALEAAEAEIAALASPAEHDAGLRGAGLRGTGLREAARAWLESARG